VGTVNEPRYINANGLKDTLDYYISEAGWTAAHNEALTWVKDEFIDAEPTADVAPVVHGHWIAIAADVHRCSNCDQLVRTKDIVPYLFCNVCGAKMDESEDKNDV
jgi:hypothetical protein